MIDMKISDEEKKELTSPSVLGDESKYPYGLKLRFNGSTYKKLGLSDPPKVGQKFMVMANAEVCEVEQHMRSGGDAEVEMGLQIVELELKPSDKQKDIAKELYDSKE